MMKKRICVVLAVFFMVLVLAGVNAGTSELKKDTRELFAQVQLFADSMTIIFEDYVESVKAKDLVYGAIRGMMKSLDGYSVFLDPESFRDISVETTGKFGGIGIEIGVREGILTVISPIDGTPASRAGIKSGDMIVKIDGELTRDLTLDEAVEKMRGEPGTSIRISVLRKGADNKVLEFDIERAQIKLESVKSARILEDGIGYIRLGEFQQLSTEDLRETVDRLRKEGAAGLVVDIRNNPGGLLDSAVGVSELFLPEGAVIVSTEARDPAKSMEFRAGSDGPFRDMTLVLVVNKGSASAAEIFAGAIRDNGRGIIVGEQTFGKGSVQTVIPLKDGSALRLTTAAYMTPSGRNLRDGGIDPDIKVPLRRVPEEERSKGTPEDKKEEVFSVIKKEQDDDDGQDGKEADKDTFDMDNQIRAALNILKGFDILRAGVPARAVSPGTAGEEASGETAVPEG
jgi:carboxyl-terminal processing protease